MEDSAAEVIDEEALCLFDTSSAFNVEVFDRIARETLDVSTTNEKVIVSGSYKNCFF